MSNSAIDNFEKRAAEKKEGAFEKHPKIEAGTYTVKVQGASYFEAKGKFPTTYYDVLLEVVESTNENFRSGETMLWRTNIMLPSAPGSINTFLAACAGVPVTSLPATAIKASVGKESAIAGVALRCIATQHTAKESGKPYIKCAWRGVKS